MSIKVTVTNIPPKTEITFPFLYAHVGKIFIRRYDNAARQDHLMYEDLYLLGGREFSPYASNLSDKEAWERRTSCAYTICNEQ